MLKKRAHIGERIAARDHEFFQPHVRDRLDAVVDREHCADGWMDHENREGAQHFGGVIGFAPARALGVRDGDDAIERGINARERLQPRSELSRKTRRARGRARITTVLRVPTPRFPGRR